MMAMSMVEALLTDGLSPPATRNMCSGEVEGEVTRYPLPSSISQPRQNRAAPFSTGHARSRRKWRSVVNR